MFCKSAIMGGASRTLSSICPNQTSLVEVVVMVWVIPWVSGSSGVPLMTPVTGSMVIPLGRAGVIDIDWGSRPS